MAVFVWRELLREVSEGDAVLVLSVDEDGNFSPDEVPMFVGEGLFCSVP